MYSRSVQFYSFVVVITTLSFFTSSSFSSHSQLAPRDLRLDRLSASNRSSAIFLSAMLDCSHYATFRERSNFIVELESAHEPALLERIDRPP